MRSLFYIHVILLIFHAPVNAQLHTDWDEMLQHFVSHNGEVDYESWKQLEGELDEYLLTLSRHVPSEDFSEKESMAFWINAYNAFTVKLILKNYPVSSIMDIADGKAWDLKWIRLDGQSYSLNKIEHEILREKYKDPRIHFAVNCAAKSCPPLMNRAFLAGKLDEQLEDRARSFICSTQYNLIEPDQIEVSRIFEWYASDFGDLKKYLGKYLSYSIQPEARISFKEYNWKLNQK